MHTSRTFLFETHFRATGALGYVVTILFVWGICFLACTQFGTNISGLTLHFSNLLGFPLGSVLSVLFMRMERKTTMRFPKQQWHHVAHRIGLLMGSGLCIVLLIGYLGEAWWRPLYYRITGQRTVADVMADYGPSAHARLQPKLLAAGFQAVPTHLTLLAFKEERVFEVWGRDASSTTWRKITIYPFTGRSGQLGPKLREGDGQIPEGLYRVVFLHPNSWFHLSLKLNYPNMFDIAKGVWERRWLLGGDIYIHGKAASIGCIPLGDPAIEELFVLVHDVGIRHTQVIIAPRDFRTGAAYPKIAEVTWETTLYQKIEQALLPFQGP